MLNCWCITWPVGFIRLHKHRSLLAKPSRNVPVSKTPQLLEDVPLETKQTAVLCITEQFFDSHSPAIWTGWKWTVAFVITQSHSWRLLTVRSSRTYSLLENSQQVGWALVFNCNSYDILMCCEFFSMGGIVGITQFSYAFKLTNSIFSNSTRNYLNGCCLFPDDIPPWIISQPTVTKGNAAQSTQVCAFAVLSQLTIGNKTFHCPSMA